MPQWMSLGRSASASHSYNPAFLPGTDVSGITVRYIRFPLAGPHFLGEKWANFHILDQPHNSDNAISPVPPPQLNSKAQHA